jgi:hypothetical protein
MKYYDTIKNVVDTATLLAEDKPVAKAIIGTIDTIIDTKEMGVTNFSVIEIVGSMAKSKWNDIKEADLVEISDIIGEDVHVELKTDENEKDSGWLGTLWQTLRVLLGFVKPMISNPEISKIVGYAEALVIAKDTGISNTAVKDTLVAMAKSFHSLIMGSSNLILKYPLDSFCA